MFTHIGALTLAPEVSEEERAALAQSFRDLAGVVPGLERVRVVLDAGLREGNCDIMFVLDFDSEASWRAYGPHPAHQALVAAHLSEGRMIGKTFLQVPAGDFV